jgi:hypothetical protein
MLLSLMELGARLLKLALLILVLLLFTLALVTCISPAGTCRQDAFQAYYVFFFHNQFTVTLCSPMMASHC